MCVCVCGSGGLLSGGHVVGVGRKKSDMLVLLERDDGRYSAGETVRGRVHIVLTQDVNVTGQLTTHSFSTVHQLHCSMFAMAPAVLSDAARYSVPTHATPLYVLSQTTYDSGHPD